MNDGGKNTAGSNEKVVDKKEALTTTEGVPHLFLVQRPKHPSDFLRLAASTRRHHCARHPNDHAGGVP